MSGLPEVLKLSEMMPTGTPLPVWPSVIVVVSLPPAPKVVPAGCKWSAMAASAGSDALEAPRTGAGCDPAASVSA